MRAVILSVLVIVPLIITPALLLYFDITPKVAVLYLGVSALLLCHRPCIAAAHAELETRAGRWLGFLTLAAFLSIVWSAAFAPDRALAIFGSTWRRMGMVSWLAVLVFAFTVAGWVASERRNVTHILRCIALAGIVASAYGIAQYFRLDPFLPISSYLAGVGRSTIIRPPGPLGHADYFASWLAMVVFASIALVRIDESVWARRAGVAAAALGTIAVVLSGTRGALLALAAGFVYLVVRLRPVPSRRSLALGAFLLLAGAAFVISPAGTFLRARFRWSINDLLGGARLLLWRDSARLALQRPLSGFGPDTFVAVFPHVQSLDLARAYPDFYHESPHNVLLDAFVGQGVFGVAVLGAFFLLGIHAAQSNGSPAAAPLGAGLIAAFVSHQFIVFVGPTALYFLVLIAILIGLDHRQRHPSRDRKEAVLLVVQLAVAAVLSVVAIRMLAADHLFSSAIQSANSGDVTVAAKQYRRALAWRLPGHSADLAYSRAMASLASRLPPGDSRSTAWNEAIESGRRSVNTSDDAQNAWYHLAILFAAQNDSAGVERCLRSASLAAPAWFKPHWALARVLELSDRRQEALAEAADALSKDGGKDPEVVETWRRLSGTKP
jgi:O-antigen ligase